MKLGQCRIKGYILSGVMLSALALTTSCSETPTAQATSTPQVSVAVSTPLVASQETPEASESPEYQGKVTVSYGKPKKKKFKKIAKVLKESGAYDDLAARLTETYKLPVDLKIKFVELGEENAYFDPNTNEIEVGYELIDTYSKIFDFDKKDPEAVKREYVDAAYFTVFHEVGHALVAILEIPITGSEEDAVDEFATIALLKMDDEQAESALLSGIEQFSADAASYQDVSELSFSDEHSFDKQRFYDVMSLVYGSDPERHADLISEDYLTEDLAASSEEEFATKSKTWDKLLAPHLREPDSEEG